MVVHFPGSRERYRSFIFVINNYSQQDLNRISKFCNEFNPTWLIYGLEHAPTTGTPHVQGTFNFEIYSFRRLLPGRREAVEQDQDKV